MSDRKTLRKALNSDDIEVVAEALDSAIDMIERMQNELLIAQAIIDMRNARDKMWSDQ